MKGFRVACVMAAGTCVVWFAFSAIGKPYGYFRLFILLNLFPLWLILKAILGRPTH